MPPTINPRFFPTGTLHNRKLSAFRSENLACFLFTAFSTRLLAFGPPISTSRLSGRLAAWLAVTISSDAPVIALTYRCNSSPTKR